MANTVGRLKQGDLLIEGEVNERAYPVTNGLVSYFPFDGASGAWDIIGGIPTAQNIESGVNLIDAMYLNWRDPNSWSSSSGITWDNSMQALKFVGYHNVWLKTPIVVDPNKTYHISYDVMIETRSAVSGGTANGYLYLGGYSLNAAKQKVTQNYDYTIASGAQPAIGVWTTYKVTRTGTAVAASGSSYSYSTVKGWTGETSDATITDKLIKYYYMGGLFNYSEGSGVMYVRDMRIEIVDSDTSNTTIMNDGLCVEEAATNVVTNIVSNYSNKATDYTTYMGQLPVDIGSQKIWHVTSGDYGGLQFSIPDTVANDIYTFSWYAYIPKAQTIKWNMQADSNVSANRGLVTLTNVIDEPGWYRFAYASTFTSAETGVRIRIENNPVAQWTSGSNECWITAIQAEKKKFATSFVDGTRAEGDFKINTAILPRNKGSIVLDVTFFEDDTINGAQGADQYSFGNQGSWNAANSWWFHDVDTWYIYGSSGGYFGRTLSSPIVRNERTHLVFVYDDTDGTLVAYKNGVLATPTDKLTAMIGQLGSLGQSWTHSGHAATTSYKMSQKIHTLAFYNRTLTSDEVRKIYGQTLKLTKQGDIQSVVIEKANDLPGNTRLFPLGTDGLNDAKSISPSTETNTVYNDGAVWIGRGTLNMITGQDYFASQSCTATYDSAFKEWTVTVPSGDTGSWRGIFYDDNDATGAPGTTHTFSFEVYADATYPIFVDINNSGTATATNTNDNDIVANRIMRIGNTEPGRWVPMSVTYSFASSLTQDFTMQNLICLGNGYVPSGAAVFKIRNIQQEQAPFASPFVDGTRAGGHLEYNQSLLNVNAGAIMGWWNFNEASRTYRGPTNDNDYAMLFSTYGASEKNKINIRSYYSWAAKRWRVEFTDATPTTSAIEFYPEDGWHFVAVCWDKTNAKVKVNVDGKLIQELTSAYTPASFDSVLRIGQWDTGVWGAMNLYMKDLMVMSSYPSDSQLSSIYKNQMRAYKDSRLQIQGQIKEGMVL